MDLWGGEIGRIKKPHQKAYQKAYQKAVSESCIKQYQNAASNSSVKIPYQKGPIAIENHCRFYDERIHFITQRTTRTEYF